MRTSVAFIAAVKLLSPGMATGRERFEREARALAQLAHPNVVTIHEVGTQDGQWFLAMEYVEGPTLRQWLSAKPDREAIVDVLRQAGRGLLAAHEVGLVHRDFKPDNVLVGDDGRVRILDFGLAKPLTDEAQLAVHTSRRSLDEAFETIGGVGTPGYVAPEQLAGLTIDVRADQYSWCVTAWESLTGELPEPTSLRKTPPLAIGERLHRALVRGMSYAREDRHDDLRPLLA